MKPSGRYGITALKQIITTVACTSMMGPVLHIRLGVVALLWFRIVALVFSLIPKPAEVVAALSDVTAKANLVRSAK